MPIKKYRIQLTDEQRQYLQKLTTTGKASARKLNRARILLLSDESQTGSKRPDKQIAEVLQVSMSTVFRVRRRFLEAGLESALQEKPRPGQPRKLDGNQKAYLIATACSTPPSGYQRWTLRLLADKMVELQVVDRISHKTVGEVLKKMNSSPGKENNGVLGS